MSKRETRNGTIVMTAADMARLDALVQPRHDLVWRPDIKTSYPIGPDIALGPVGSFVQTTFRLTSETLTALA
jgi:hypothetical protein